MYTYYVATLYYLLSLVTLLNSFLIYILVTTSAFRFIIAKRDNIIIVVEVK